MDGEGMGELAIERHLAQIELVCRTRTAAVRIGRRKLANYTGRRVVLVLIIGQAETIAVPDKSVAYWLAGHVYNPGLAYGASSPQRTGHPLRVDLEWTRGQKIHRRTPPCSDAQPAFWRSSYWPAKVRRIAPASTVASMGRGIFVARTDIYFARKRPRKIRTGSASSSARLRTGPPTSSACRRVRPISGAAGT